MINKREFKTIEEFVSMLDERTKENSANSKLVNLGDAERGTFLGMAIAYGYIAEVVRQSNLGIVYPAAK